MSRALWIKKPGRVRRGLSKEPNQSVVIFECFWVSFMVT